MSLANLTDSALLSATKTIARKERKLLAEVLHHLREVDRRRLYSSLRYKSLHEYAVKELGYADDAAYRRINAMRLLKELPQLETRIASGRLNLSTINAATKVFRAEARTQGGKVGLERKLEMLATIENKSTNEAEAVLQKLTTAPKELLKPEKIKIREDYVDFSFRAKRSLEEKGRKIKDILSHSHPNLTTAELFEMLCSEFLEKHERSMLRGENDKSSASKKVGSVRSSGSINGGDDSETQRSAEWDETQASIEVEKALEPPEVSQKNHERLEQKNALSGSGVPRQVRKYISIQIQRQVQRKCEQRCSGCGSTRFLEIDHIHPIGMGGSNDLDNLRVLCRNCNQRAAIEKFGLAKMQRFLELGLDS